MTWWNNALHNSTIRFQAHGTSADVRRESDRVAADQQRAGGRRRFLRVPGEQRVRQGPAAGAVARARAAGPTERPEGDRGDQHVDQRPVGPQRRPDVQVHSSAQKVRRYVNRSCATSTLSASLHRSLSCTSPLRRAREPQFIRSTRVPSASRSTAETRAS